MSSQPAKRPEMIDGIRVRMPDDYDFNTWGKRYVRFRQKLR